ncbi:MAG: DUF2231 domain-containing protein [Gemmatimonadota bacterium]
MDLLPMHSWHPMMIHFPLVALALAVVLDAVSAWTGSDRWRTTATLLWWVGLIGAAAAVATGLVAYNRVEHSELAHDRMTLHRNLAFAAVAVLLSTAIWRWRRRASPLGAVVGVAGLGLLLGVGYLGGELVFRHALGVPTETLEQISHERGSEAHHHGVETGENHARDHADSSMVTH